MSFDYLGDEMHRTTVSVLLAIVAVTGCAGTQLDIERSALTRQGHPPQYIDGYVDGCSSGNRAAGSPYFKLLKNHTRYNQDKLYNQGWDNGFTICKAEYESIKSSVR